MLPAKMRPGMLDLLLCVCPSPEFNTSETPQLNLELGICREQEYSVLLDVFYL